MGTFIRLAVDDFLLPLMIWSGVFALVATVPGVVMVWWLRQRIRVVSPPDARLSRARRWTAGGVVASTSFAIPLVIGLLHAVPFAVERSLIRTIERSAPLASDWMVDLGSGQMARLVGVTEQDTAIDVLALSTRATDALATLQSQGSPQGVLDRLRWLTVTTGLGAMRTASAQLPAKVSWADLIQATKSIMRAQVSWLNQGTLITLEAAAAAQVISAATQLAVSHAVTIFFVLVMIPGSRFTRRRGGAEDAEKLV